MKKGKCNPYQNNEAGVIKAPKSVGGNSPKATVTKGNDLRSKKGK